MSGGLVDIGVGIPPHGGATLSHSSHKSLSLGVVGDGSIQLKGKIICAFGVAEILVGLA